MSIAAFRVTRQASDNLKRDVKYGVVHENSSGFVYLDGAVFIEINGDGLDRRYYLPIDGGAHTQQFEPGGPGPRLESLELILYEWCVCNGLIAEQE